MYVSSLRRHRMRRSAARLCRGDMQPKCTYSTTAELVGANWSEQLQVQLPGQAFHAKGAIGRLRANNSTNHCRGRYVARASTMFFLRPRSARSYHLVTKKLKSGWRTVKSPCGLNDGSAPSRFWARRRGENDYNSSLLLFLQVRVRRGCAALGR